jgi:hypothetical protein
LWKKYQEDESILKKLYKKLRYTWNNIKEMKVKKEADKLISNL